MKNNKIALCIIAAPTDDESDVLYRLLSTEGLHKKFDGIFITITCQKHDSKGEKVRLVAEQAKANISYFKWIDDFAAARNFNFSQVPKDYEWTMWLDCDDIVKGSKYIKNVIKKTDDNISAIIFPYLYDFDEYGECTVKHNKIRIIRNDESFRWEGNFLHEDLFPLRKINNYFCKDIQICHLTNHQRVDVAIKRNVRISEKALQKYSNDPRSYWNYANSTYMAGDYKKSIETFFEFIKKSGSEEEIYMAWNRVAMIYFKLQDYERSIESALEALRIRPWYPDAYFTLSQSFFNNRQFRHSKEMLLTGLNKKIPDDTAIVWNPRDYDYNPLMLLAKVYYQLNDPTNSYLILEKLSKMFPKHEEVKRVKNEIKKVKNELETVDKICDKIKKCKNKNQIKDLLDNVSQKLKSHPKLCYLRNIHFVKEQSSGRDLDIYCFETAEEWNPEIVKVRGMGGSEEAVINLAPRLADLGWNVTVYNTCGYQSKQYEKVLWRPHWEFNYRDKRDIVVSWRHPMLYNRPVNSKKSYVWLHDTIGQNEFTNKRLNNITKIIPLSNWHRGLYPDISNDKFMISSNGINSEQFKNLECLKRDPYRLIYTSAPERGLNLLLELFPEIKKRVPQATLALYYGWETWDSVYQEDIVQQEWKKKIIQMINQPGIVSKYERITHDKIVEEYLKSSIFAYPTGFTEINCISIQKAQAAGAIPITTDVAALDQYNKWGIKIKGKDIYSNKQLQKKWVDAVVYLLKNQWKQEEIRKKMIPLAIKEFDWDNIAKQWHQEFLQ